MNTKKILRPINLANTSTQHMAVRTIYFTSRVWYNYRLMKYAVIQLQGKQYRVEPGQTLTVDLLPGKPGDVLTITDVLLLKDGEKVTVGTPLVAGAKVNLKIIASGKDKKLRVFKYKAKSKYRKTIGHRQAITNLEVSSIA